MSSTIGSKLSIKFEEDKLSSPLYNCLYENGDERSKLLWDILINCDIDNRQELEDKIYSYGSELREKDYFGRAIFLRMTKFLELV